MVLFLCSIFDSICEVASKFRYRFAIFYIITFLAVILGVVGAVSVGNIDSDILERVKVVIYVNGDCGFFSYFIYKILTVFFIVLLICFCSAWRKGAYISFVIIFMYAYIYVYQVTLIILIGGIIVLPFCIFGMLIYFLLSVSFLVVFSLSVCSCGGFYNGIYYVFDYTTSIYKNVIVVIVLHIIIAFLETLIVGHLSSGIIFI